MQAMPIMAEKRKAGFGVLPNVVFYKSGSTAPRRLLFFAIFLLRRHADYKDEKFFSASCRLKK